jgi:hypothetical protein
MIPGDSVTKRTLEDTSTTNTNTSTSIVSTDGRGYLGLISASAINLYNALFDRKHLGTEDQSTIYATELSGIEIALIGVRTTIPDLRRPTAPVEERWVVRWNNAGSRDQQLYLSILS